MSHGQSLEDWIFKCIGGLSVLVCISSMIPQIHKMCKTKKTNDLSITGYYINFCGITLIEIYAFYFNLWEIFIPNVLSWLLILLQILLKKCYDSNIEELNVNFLTEDSENSIHNIQVVKVDISPISSSIASDMDLEFDSNLDLDTVHPQKKLEKEYDPYRTTSYSPEEPKELL